MDISSKKTEQRACFVLPTFNEEGNIENVIKKIFESEDEQSSYDFSILVVDDNSLDDTQSIVKRLIKSNNKIHLITGEKKGLGEAYKRGFKYAIDELNTDLIFQMDSDG